MSRTPERDWMWSEACELIERAERMHRQFFRLSNAPRAEATWEPPADVLESEDEMLVVVALPGVSADRVTVSSEPGMLVVRAERPQPLRGLRHAVRQMEIPYGVFERRIPLPPQRFELAQTELTHGCLLLRLRKTA